MKERPIIISTQLIPPTLDGRKTMTRRPVKPQPSCARMEYYGYNGEHWMTLLRNDVRKDIWVPTSNSGKVGIFEKPYYVSPHGQPGDRLWVREDYQITVINDDQHEVSGYYSADGASFLDVPLEKHEWEKLVNRKNPYRFCSGRFMYKSLARIRRDIVNVRVERLQEINKDDLEAEGFRGTLDYSPIWYEEFHNYWDSLYTKKPEFQWEANCWVWVVEFNPQRRE